MTDMQEYSEQVRQIIQDGEHMSLFMESPHWINFKAVILDVMDKEAYACFCNTDPNETEKVRQFQIFGQVVKGIEARMLAKIQQGKLALNQHTEEEVQDE